jgi:hypothetical protein
MADLIIRVDRQSGDRTLVQDSLDRDRAAEALVQLLAGRGWLDEVERTIEQRRAVDRAKKEIPCDVY